MSAKFEDDAIRQSTLRQADFARFPLDKAKNNLDLIVKRIIKENEEIIITQDGKDLVAVISLEAFKFLLEKVREMEEKIDVEEAENILASTKLEEYIPYQQLREELGLG
ncbi:type II toxin-antitoxin system prevent-host-death family antitoxin [Oscillatoria salina]|uniref:type II toxin-antitoxin system prevent-host-death family antitoxin n=1 Tax=Oscillatoria salina TaxID=331517 RepID=UPI0013B9114D|nr:type II toxin-antitoxin system prevent-host-death family antitoxin [Oscillatoria salina]MBZ8182147.1 type II toxin-antitoxin system prevent-host-death family antitoxin [Oscillatoria salina IIICB1]NET89139.1 type II toxin-antitoxin system prevent-host-death family antitoxin [Kamptonema sp. SIO1D9]